MQAGRTRVTSLSVSVASFAVGITRVAHTVHLDEAVSTCCAGLVIARKNGETVAAGADS